MIGIVNLLAMITERDYAVDKLLKDYQTPLKLSAPQFNEWKIGETNSLEVLVSGLKNEQERSSVTYHLQSLAGESRESALSKTPTVNPENGNATFSGTFTKGGEYRFKVWADVTRQLPKDAGGQRLRMNSDTATFAILVSTDKYEIPGTRFSMGVDKKAEHWVAGVPYHKRVFVNTDPQKVRLIGLPSVFHRRVAGANSIELLWEKPLPGTMQVALRGNAGRSLDQSLDEAKVEFVVSVEPPTWNPAPQKVAYWNLAYTFSSKVGELDENDYAIKVLANGSIPVESVSKGQSPLVVVPEQSWSSLTFIATSNAGDEMLRAEIPVKAPPPPQIKWTSSRLEGDDYVIQFSAEDVGGKDANVNCSIVSPSSLTGILSARHGKKFIFTIKNVTKTRPQAIIVRTSIHGIGGVSTPLDRTFPILY
jgi:hypothetical protein